MNYSHKGITKTIPSRSRLHQDAEHCAPLNDDPPSGDVDDDPLSHNVDDGPPSGDVDDGPPSGDVDDDPFSHDVDDDPLSTQKPYLGKT